MLCVIASIALNTTSYAADANQTFVLTLVNHSNETLMIQSVEAASGVNFIPDRELWAPGTTIHIIAENIASNGVLGHVRFLDGKRHIASLRLEVREQRHTGQPVFGINNQFYKSIVLSKTRNPNVGGRYLTYTDATIELQQNN